MDNKNEILKNSKLLKKLHKRFWSSIIIFSLSIIITLVLLFIEIKIGLKLDQNGLLILTYVLILVILIVISIIDIKPLFKDIVYIKIHEPKMIIGEVIKYRKVVQGGDPDTTNYYPTIRDRDKEWIEVEVKADCTELNKIYHCIYLPNTKLAVCEEVQNLNEKT